MRKVTGLEVTAIAFLLTGCWFTDRRHLDNAVQAAGERYMAALEGSGPDAAFEWTDPKMFETTTREALKASWERRVERLGPLRDWVIEQRDASPQADGGGLAVLVVGTTYAGGEAVERLCLIKRPGGIYRVFDHRVDSEHFFEEQ